MRSTFAGLTTVFRGLYSQQVSLDTVGHNIANANTDGYSRQSVNMTATTPGNIYTNKGPMQIGSGVDVLSITRARDVFVDKQFWKENSSMAYGQTTQDTLGKIEGVFGEPTDTGMQTVLNRFWSAWQTLGVNASDEGARTAVRERGVELVNAIKHSTQQLKDMAADINSVIEIKVNKVNQLTSEIASLNKQISNIESCGTDHANDLRDRRDLLVDQLTSITSVQVTEDNNRNYIIQSAGATLVEGNNYTEWEVIKPPSLDPDYGYEIYNVAVEGTVQSLNFLNGELKGLLESRDSSQTGVKGYLDKLSTISQFLLQDFNKVHRSGFGMDNINNRNFFDNVTGSDPDYTDPLVSGAFTKGDWIATLQVNPEFFDPANGLTKIAAKVSIAQSNVNGGGATLGGAYAGPPASTTYAVRLAAVAAGVVNSIDYSTDGGSSWTNVAVGPPFALPNGVTIAIATDAVQNAVGDTYTFTLPHGNASGDNAVALSNRLKIDSMAVLGNTSLDTYYSSFIGALGVQSQNAKRLTDNQEALVDQIKKWRESTAGINMDEEMTNMIRFQKGYNAAARVMTTMDEMLDKLINGTGVVGR